MSGSLTEALARRERNITIGGREWRLAVPRLRSVLRLEGELRRRKADPIGVAAAHAAEVPTEHRETYWREAFAASRAGSPDVALDKLMADMPMRMQLAAAAWMYLQEHHAAEMATLDDAIAWIETAMAEDAVDWFSTVLQSLAEPTAGPAARSPEKKGALSENPSPGKTSSESVPPDLVGPQR